MSIAKIGQRIEAAEMEAGTRDKQWVCCLEEIDGTLREWGGTGQEIDPSELDGCNLLVFTSPIKEGGRWLTEEEAGARYPKRRERREKEKQREAHR